MSEYLHFTTPEQSQRLLDMGIPSWTADFEFNELLPCWSVCRLIEIINTYSILGKISIRGIDIEVTQIEQLIDILQNRIN